MPIIGFAIVVQILCAVHCVRGGGNRMWLMVIIFLSLPGCFAYLVFEVLPAYSNSRQARVLKSAAIRKLDPERQVRAAREALATADTVANHVVLADALVDNEVYGEAIRHYREAINRSPTPDRAIQYRLASAELDAGNAAEACRLLEASPPSNSHRANDEAGLLLARALQEMGEKERALETYADVGRRLPGGEAQCRQAALLVEMGRRSEARVVLEDVERIMRKLDRLERARNPEMYDWAKRTLTEIRSY